MGRYKLQRPAWNPRGQEVKYIVNGRVLSRGWPKRYHDAKSATQLRQRSKIAQLSGVMSKLKCLFAYGYEPGARPNGRRVGSYQMAFSHASKYYFTNESNGYTLHLERLMLTDGVTQLPQGLHTQRAQSKITLQWERPDIKKEKIVLFAARNKESDALFAEVIFVKSHENHLTITLPKDWKAAPIEMWSAWMDANRKCKSITHYEKFN